MTAWNPFRIVGDFSHLASKFILLFSIHRNRSAEGVSFITQALYALVFLARYTDIFSTRSKYNLIFKIFYIFSSFYTLGVMQWVFPRTREKELSWKLGAACFFGALLSSPLIMLILHSKVDWSLFYWLWDFSYILESICVLPQLLLLRQTSVPTVIDSYYLLALGMYRVLYILNWISREFDSMDGHPKAVQVIFGVIQTALYADFAWVYYSRQRVKLRSGGVVDADDMRRSWLLRRIFGKHLDSQHSRDDDGDEESAPALGGSGSGGRGPGRSAWGRRGISVSADEGILGQDSPPFSEEEHGILGADGESVDPDAKMKDPDELALALDEDEDDLRGSSTVPSGVSNGGEWRD